MKVKYTIEDLVHNVVHAEWGARLNEIQDDLRQYGHIVQSSPEANPAVFVVEYEGDGWDVREWADEAQADLSSFGHTTMERVEP